MNVRRMVPALAVAACAAGMFGGRQAMAAASPKVLVLQTHDLSRVYAGTFHRGLGVAIGPTGFGGVSVGKSSTLARHGLVTGYTVIYERMSGSQFGISNAVSAFRDSSGPRWELNYVLTHLPKPGKGQAIHISSLSGLGDGAVLFTTSVRVRTLTRTISAGVAFIRGRYAVTVSVIDTAGPNRADVIALARIEDSKVQHQG